MKLISPAFSHKGTIPTKYTCDGSNVSPPFAINDVPPEARSLAMIAEDPDAPGGVFTHWVSYNIPVAVEAIHENTEPGLTGTNDFNARGYGGPCPPSDTHRYVFTLYALDRKLDLQPGCSRVELQEAMVDHVVETSQVVGLYGRE